MKKMFVLFTALILIIATMTVWMATAYSQTTQVQTANVFLMNDIEEIRSGHDLSDASEQREVFKDLLLYMGIDEVWAERFAQYAPEQAVDGIVNAEEIGGTTKTFSNTK